MRIMRDTVVSLMKSDPESSRLRLRVAITSIVMGVLILGLKYYAYAVSGSTALKSDAIESVVNIIAAFFALGAVIFADKPADKEHPYGHGKIEHFSAAVEGGLITLAAVLIAWEAVGALLHGVELKELGKGLALNFGAGLLNGLLGMFLVWMGRKHRSRAIEADGHHVLSDFYTTLGIALGLLLVKFTGIRWLDPLMALGVAALLGRTGIRLVLGSSQALLDREDKDLLEHLVDHDQPPAPGRHHHRPRAPDHAQRALHARRHPHGAPRVLRHGPRPRFGGRFRQAGDRQFWPGRRTAHARRSLPAQLVRPVWGRPLRDPPGTPGAAAEDHPGERDGSGKRMMFTYGG